MVWIQDYGGMFGTNTGCCWTCRAGLSKVTYLTSHVLPLLVHIDEQSKKAGKLNIGIMQ